MVFLLDACSKLKKAYDSIEWPFLDMVLHELGSHVCFGPLDVEVMLSLCSYSMMLSVIFLLSPGLILTTLYSADAD